MILAHPKDLDTRQSKRYKIKKRITLISGRQELLCIIIDISSTGICFITDSQIKQKVVKCTGLFDAYTPITLHILRSSPLPNIEKFKVAARFETKFSEHQLKKVVG